MAISAATATAIGAGVSAAGSIAGGVMGANAQNAALGRAQGMVGEGIAGSVEMRQALEEWGGTFRDYMTELAKPIMREATAAPTESQAYRDATQMLSRQLAGSGNIRSGAAVQGFRDLAATEADRKFQQQTDAARLFGQTGLGAAQLSAGLLRGEMSAKAQQAELEAQQGAVTGSLYGGIGETLGSLGGAVSGVFGGKQASVLGSEALGGNGASNPVDALGGGLDFGRVANGLTLGGR